jgi:hypothetical protein
LVVLAEQTVLLETIAQSPELPAAELGRQILGGFVVRARLLLVPPKVLLVVNLYTLSHLHLRLSASPLPTAKLLRMAEVLAVRRAPEEAPELLVVAVVPEVIPA